MRELVEALPSGSGRRRVLYLASGAHLGAAGAVRGPAGRGACELVLTEVDPAVQGAIGGFLGELVRLELASALDVGDPLGASGGSRSWRLRLGSHPVTVTLRVEGRGPGGAPPPLIRASDLAGADLVISHDWSGDPLSNLRVVYDLLVAARAAGGRAPLLMVEDLEQHPYPVDLSFFSPRARTRLPYGHRTSGAGVGRHGAVELGEPLFGGGVLLGFAAPWWREVDPDTLEGLFNFLLFNQFDDQRRTSSRAARGQWWRRPCSTGGRGSAAVPSATGTWPRSPGPGNACSTPRRLSPPASSRPFAGASPAGCSSTVA